MNTLRLFLCGLATASALSSCAYDDSSYSYGWPVHDRLSPYYPYGPGYIYRTSAPPGYVTNRYLTPVVPRMYVYR